MFTDETEILIVLKNALKAKSERDFHVVFSDMDSELGLLAGSTKKHIKVAAEALDYKIGLEAPTMIELKKPSGTRLMRG